MHRSCNWLHSKLAVRTKMIRVFLRQFLNMRRKHYAMSEGIETILIKLRKVKTQLLACLSLEATVLSESKSKRVGI